MFTRMIDDIKDSTGSAMQTDLARRRDGAGFFGHALIPCAAAFVYVLQNYGPIEACLTGAGIFFAAALIGILCLRRPEAAGPASARKETAKSALHTALADPVLVATALQVVRAIGIKKLVPILAVGGLALGLLASRTFRQTKRRPSNSNLSDAPVR